MYNDPAAWDRINSFALVSYIPEPLAGFLDRLRQELVPNCFLRAHVTILPPRPICSTPEAAWETVRTLAPRFAPFDVEMTQVEVFPVSDVIHIGIGRGREEMERLHRELNVDGLKFTEPYPYHPHITLAQDLKGDEVDELARVARTRWAEIDGSQDLSRGRGILRPKHAPQGVARSGRKRAGPSGVALGGRTRRPARGLIGFEAAYHHAPIDELKSRAFIVAMGNAAGRH